MIVLANVTKVYPRTQTGQAVTAVKGASLEIQPGVFLVVTGRSGSGKTTLLNLIAGLTSPTSGSVLFHGVDWWTLPDRVRSLERARKIGFIFQFPSLLPSLTSLENGELPAEREVLECRLRAEAQDNRNQREQPQNHQGHAREVPGLEAQKVNRFNAAGVLAEHRANPECTWQNASLNKAEPAVAH